MVNKSYNNILNILNVLSILIYLTYYKGVEPNTEEREYLEEHFKKEGIKTSYIRRVGRNK